MKLGQRGLQFGEQCRSRGEGTGVGAALMTEARRRAEAAGFERMHLSVHPENRRALDFYRAGGWTELADPDGSWTGRMSCPLPHAGA